MRFGLWIPPAVLLVFILAGGQGAVRAEEPRGRLVGAAASTGDFGAMRRALCIGIDGYQDATYGPLRYATDDARALARTLAGLGYETTLMIDGDETIAADHRPTYRNLDDRIHAFCRQSTRPGDTLVITFAGHGDVIDGQSVVVPLDYHSAGRTLTVGSLFDAVRRAKAKKKLLVLDACRSAKRDATRTLQSGFLQSLGQAESLVVLSGCGADQYAFEDERLGHGRLTQCLLDGLGGQAFGDGREFLFGHELWGYVERTFHERGWAETQSPTLFGTWDARVRFDIARREIAPPLPISGEDREIFEMTLERAIRKSADADHTASVKYCTTALRILEREPRALARRAYAYVSLGYGDRATQDVELVLEQDADHPLALVLYAMLALVEEDLSKAHARVQRMQEAFMRTPKRWRTGLPPEVGAAFWMGIGYLYGQMGNSAESQIEAYGWALAMEGAPPSILAQTRINRGLVYNAIGRHGDAAADFGAVFEIEGAPGDLVAFARFDRGLLHHLAGRVEAAHEDFAAVVETEGAEDQTVVGALWQLALLDRAAGREVDAGARYVARLERVREDAARWAATSLGYGFFLTTGGANQDAIRLYEAVVVREGAPRNIVAQAWGHLGVLFGDARRFEDALRALRQCLELAAGLPAIQARAWNVQGTMLEAAGRSGEALAAYGEAARIEGVYTSERGEALLRVAIQGADLNRPDLSLEHANLVLQMKGLLLGFHLVAHMTRARAYVAAGSPEKAREALDAGRAIKFAYAGMTSLAWADRARVRALLGDDPESAGTGLAGTQVPLDESGAAWLDGLAAVGRRDWGEARKLLDAARSKGPLPVHVRFALMELSMRSGAPQEAIVLYVWLRWVMGDRTLDPEPVVAFAKANPDHPLASLASDMTD